MIKIKLKNEYLQSLYFDGIGHGRLSFRDTGDHHIGELTNPEFDSFLKENNLIMYRNTIKGYEDGEIYGEVEI